MYIYAYHPLSKEHLHIHNHLSIQPIVGQQYNANNRTDTEQGFQLMFTSCIDLKCYLCDLKYGIVVGMIFDAWYAGFRIFDLLYNF